jgi:hypothetical protein
MNPFLRGPGSRRTAESFEKDCFVIGTQHDIVMKKELPQAKDLD